MSDVQPDEFTIEWDNPDTPPPTADYGGRVDDGLWDTPEKDSMAKPGVMEIDVKLNLLPINEGDLLILRGVYGEEELQELLDALVLKAKTDGGHLPLVAVLNDGQDIEVADEATMKAAGWVRDNDGTHSHTIPVVDEALLRNSTDASVWAKEFAKIQPLVDEGTMIAWFANAIETAKNIQMRTPRENY